MDDVEKIASVKDAVMNLVYQHMGPRGSKSLYTRTAFDLVDANGDWNAREFVFLKTYFFQLYGEIANYIETVLARPVSPVSAQMYEAHISNMISKEFEDQVRLLFLKDRTSYLINSQFVMETSLDTSRKSKARELILTSSVFIDMTIVDIRKFVKRIPLVSNEFHIEAVPVN